MTYADRELKPEQDGVPSCAIYFHPEAYSTSGKQLMGRNAAGESFLKGYLKHATTSNYYAYVRRAEEAQAMAHTASPFGVEEIKAIEYGQSAFLTQAETLYYPGPDIGQQAFARSNIDPAGWSICGITHTTSSAAVMDGITALLTAPVEPWDAVICTSSAVKQHVETLLQAEVDRLQQRLGIQSIRLPQLPIIPLGIHTDDFRYSAEQKVQARAAIKADDNSFVVVYMGRLSFHAKAHPLAMYQALEQAAQQTGKTIKLIECGWFANDYTQKAFQEAQAAACPSVEVIYLDGREKHNRDIAWASADAFCSFSDNVQETFGITPIEAMAVGLPVVVSDWDGYRDSVTEEVGFKVPTSMPQGGLAGDLAFRHGKGIDDYNFYCGHSCLHIGVDIPAAADAFIQLIESTELRAQMGAAGLQRAQDVYDWSGIIPQYEQLWTQLREIRLAAQQENPQLSQAQVWPARMDPFTSFGHYASQTLTLEGQVARVDNDLDFAQQRLTKLLALEMVKFGHQVLLREEALIQLLGQIATQATAVKTVVAVDNGHEPALNLRALGLLHKLGLIVICSD